MCGFSSFWTAEFDVSANISLNRRRSPDPPPSRSQSPTERLGAIRHCSGSGHDLFIFSSFRFFFLLSNGCDLKCSEVQYFKQKILN